MNAPAPTPVWLRRFTKFVAASTLFLIFAGAMVTSTGSGLAVPDWPLNYGMLFPKMVGGILYETGHRHLASTVGLLTLIQAIWLQRREPKRFLRILGWCSVGFVIAQGILGGMTVLFLQPHALSVAHGAVAELFLCINVSIAFFASRTFARLRDARVNGAPVALTGALALATYAQILLGAVMRHIGAGLAIPDFPLSMSRLIPPLTSAAVIINFSHRVGAAVVTLLALAAIFACLRTPVRELRRLAVFIAAIVALQVALGASVVLLAGGNEKIFHSLVGDEAMRLAMITSLHVVTGAATLATTLLAALVSRAVAQPASRDVAAYSPSEVAA